ncbi:hypothetical protein HPB52_012447 [Rhipicephalus sanguineus]|uniref:Uncharacterized protein n=1 Tax=Rhipicephalus sanguineus TaxID=34632 RepID=A0A9D4QC08_RHISA|nr:hypothetical protein HPB52_012447 [Rhipicephalus sanguineus]
MHGFGLGFLSVGSVNQLSRHEVGDLVARNAAMKWRPDDHDWSPAACLMIAGNDDFNVGSEDGEGYGRFLGVRGMASGDQKLMNYMCGSYGVRHCTAQHFLDFVGAVRSEGGHSPLKIRYVLTELPISVDGRTLTPFKPDLDLIAQKSNAGVQLRQYAK